MTKAALIGAGFVGIMVVTVLLTYPLLLVPHKANEIFDVLQKQSAVNNFGGGVRVNNGPLRAYSTTLRDGFGLWPMYIVALSMGFIGLLSEKRRTLNIITLTWSITFFVYLLFVVARNVDYYFMPALLPLFALIWQVFDLGFASRARQLFLAGIVLLLAVQISLYIEHDVQTFARLASQEKNSPTIQFYNDLLSHNILSKDASSSGRIFHDPNIYLPSEYDQETSFATTYYYVASFNPEVILLGREKIDNFSNPLYVDPDNAFDKDLAVLRLEFYGDAKNNQIEGYSEVFRNGFAVAFKRRGDMLIPSVGKGSNN